VSLFSAGTITSAGAGTGSTVTVRGFGGNTAGSGSYNDGVYVYNAQITSNGGAVLVEGTGGGGGTGRENKGVYVYQEGVITSAGTGAGATVTVRGWGGNTGGTSGDYNSGVMLWGTNARITSSGGAVLVAGTGGGAGNGRGNYGVNVSNPGTITSAGPQATVTVTGVSNAAATGSDNTGVNIYMGSITSSGGDIAVNGTGGGGPSGYGIQISDGGQILGTTGTPTVTLTADAMNLLSTTSVDAGANAVLLRPRTAGTRIDLGGADVLAGSPLTLGLTDAELDSVTAGTLTIGDGASGAITVSAAVSRPGSTNVGLTTGGTILFNSGLDTGGGALLLTPGATGSVQPQAAGADATTTGNTTSFASDSVLRIDIAGTTVDSQYDQLNVLGAVDLDGVALDLGGSYVSADGDAFTIVSATSVASTFTGLAEGALIEHNGRSLRIAYTASTVRLIDDAPPVVVDPIGDLTVAEDAPDTVLDLGPVFDDANLPQDDALTYTVTVSEPIDSLVAQVSQSSYTTLHQDLLYTHTGDNRGIGGPEHDLARENIQSYFVGLGLDTSLQQFLYNSATYYNVVGVYPGVTDPEDIYLVGAHYDSVNNPGADDNASGVAAVMELARVLTQYEFDATLVFVAFDQEEQGLWGSKAYANAHASDNILGMLSLDMIAYNPAANHDTVRFYDSVVRPTDTIKSALATAFASYSGGLATFNAGTINASDHYPFELAGVDAALVIEYNVWSNPYYHQLTDAVETADNIDYVYATKVTRGVMGYLATAAGLRGPSELLTATVDGQDLTLDYALDAHGIADIQVRATDTQGLYAEDTFRVTVNAVNDAPVLDNTGTMTLAAINEDHVTNTGTRVRDIVASAGNDRITDVDYGALEGMAVTAVDNAHGTWQYTVNNGRTWLAFGSPTAATARLLGSDIGTRVRFVPGANWHGTVDPAITFRAWDHTQGFNGQTADASTGGGATAFSEAIETARIEVLAVNDPPTVDLTNVVTQLAENTDTSSPLPVADIVVWDDDQGTNSLSRSGADADLFTIVGTTLYLNAGAVLDFEANPTLDITVEVDDPAVGAAPDDTAAMQIAVTDIDEIPPEVMGLMPPDDGTGVAVDTNLVITFSEPVQKGAGDIVVRRLSDGTAVETIPVTDGTRVTVEGVTVTIDPAATLAESTAYYVEIAAGALEDAATNDFAGISGNTTWNFTTLGTTSAVVNRRIFYNNSKWDGHTDYLAGDPAPNEYDDAAIATDKAALLPGETPTFANYTSYTRGINGIMVDIAGLVADVTAADFVFKVGNSSTPSAWASAPAPTSVSVRPGAGVDGSARVTVIWPDNAIQKQWLQIIVLANGNTGLPADDVFYFGNAIGEVGDTTANALVNATDCGRVKINWTFPNQAGLTNVYDLNRDKVVNATDAGLALVNQTYPSNMLRLITPPEALQALGGGLVGSPAVSDLSETDLQSTAAAAVACWADAGLDAHVLAKMSEVQFVLADLSGGALALASPTVVYIDTNAAGYGWFVDETPADDEEFLQVVGSRALGAVGAEALGRMDLLTVVTHELGHVAGLKDLTADQDDVMGGALTVGVRRIPCDGGLDGFFGVLGTAGMDRPAGYVNESAVRQTGSAMHRRVRPMTDSVIEALVETALLVRDGRTVASKRRAVNDDLFDLLEQKGFEFDLLGGRT